MKISHTILFFWLFVFRGFATESPDSTEFPIPDSLAHSPVMVGMDSVELLVEHLDDAEDSAILDVLEALVPRRSPVPLIESRSRVSRRLDLSRGFTEGRYEGSSWKSYQRLKVSQGDHLAGAIIVEKDPGESKLNDFGAGYLRVGSLGVVRNIVVGDYIIEAGQGVALWRGYDFRKGAEIILPVKRVGRGLVPYASSDENTFLRGAAVECEWEGVSLIGFYSRKSMSASLDTSGRVTSFYSSGYFRTLTEREKRNNVRETLFGLSGSYLVSGDMRVGLTAFTSQLSREIAVSAPESPVREINVIASDYLISIDSARFFGEWSISNSHVGGISGVHFEPARSMDIVTAYRAYPAGFMNLHNNGFGERLGTTNERGWYLGVRLRPVRRVRLSAYYDLFSFPGQSTSTLFGGGGHEVLVQADIRPLPRLLVTPRIRSKMSVEKKSFVDEFNRSVQFDDERMKTSYRLTAEYQLNPSTKLRSRFEYVDVHFRYLQRRERGVLVYNDVVVKPFSSLTINGRLTLFDTDSFDSAIGEYERDLSGVLTVPVLYGKGVRWYLFVQYRLLEPLVVSVKYSELIRDDVKTIGTGLDEIMTNRDNRISLQMDLSM